MLILKIMGPGDGPDDDARKTHSLITSVRSVVFASSKDGPVAEIVTVSQWGEDQSTIKLEGNAYVMNEAGKTISSFCPDAAGEPSGPKRG